MQDTSTTLWPWWSGLQSRVMPGAASKLSTGLDDPWGIFVVSSMEFWGIHMGRTLQLKEFLFWKYPKVMGYPTINDYYTSCHPILGSRLRKKGRPVGWKIPMSCKFWVECLAGGVTNHLAGDSRERHRQWGLGWPKLYGLFDAGGYFSSLLFLLKRILGIISGLQSFQHSSNLYNLHIVYDNDYLCTLNLGITSSFRMVSKNHIRSCILCVFPTLPYVSLGAWYVTQQ